MLKYYISKLFVNEDCLGMLDLSVGRCSKPLNSNCVIYVTFSNPLRVLVNGLCGERVTLKYKLWKQVANSYQPWFERQIWHCTKKWSFPLRISSVYVTKSVGNCGPNPQETERIWLHLLKKSLIENFIFCAVIDDS